MRVGTLQVHVRSGADLSLPSPPANVTPCFVMRIAAHKARTSYGASTSMCSFDEQFSFDRVSDKHKLVLECLNTVAKEASAETSIGQVVIPISRLPCNHKIDQWYCLEPKEGGHTLKAAVQLALQFDSAGEETLPGEEQAATAAGDGRQRHRGC